MKKITEQKNALASSLDDDPKNKAPLSLTEKLLENVLHTCVGHKDADQSSILRENAAENNPLMPAKKDERV